MTLVIAFIGKQGAVMAGDMREITFHGDDSCVRELEHDLYSGLIASDEDLQERASEIGVTIRVRDDKAKIAQCDSLLTGEVTETEGPAVRKKRICATRGSYVLAEVIDSRLRVLQKGRASNFVVLGNKITKEIANHCIKEGWDGGGVPDAIRLIMLTMQVAASVTASVSRTFMLVHTDQVTDIMSVVDQDSRG